MLWDLAHVLALVAGQAATIALGVCWGIYIAKKMGVL